MTPRDWTPTDAADATDADRDRNWWRRDPCATDDRPDADEARSKPVSHEFREAPNPYPPTRTPGQQSGEEG